MSKKRVQFDIDEDHESNKQENNQDEEKLPFNKKFKHTLDSDEEDDEIEDEKKYEFNPELFEGEEEGNLHNEGEITITPFNVKDELQEGHFDDQGTFIFKKEREEIKDNWIDNIDWTKVKDDNKEEQKKDDQSEEEDDNSKFDSDDCLKKLLELMEPNETVQKAMQRLGKSKLKNNKNRNQQKKDKKTTESNKDDDEEKQRKEKLNSLIELSNLLLNDGDMDIYEKKYERIKYQLDENLRNKSKEQIQSTSANDNLDIFAD